MNKLWAVIFCCGVLAAGCSTNTVPVETQTTSGQEVTSTSGQFVANEQPAVFADPISNPRSRVTKKPLGIYVTPKQSPVSPERFTGYHSGVDFEVTEAEQGADVPVYAICDGKLLEKKTAMGYGGVLVQSCVLDDKSVIVIYGHVRLSSVKAVINQELEKGSQVAVLGTGYSSETDNERKHLHLGIHRGSGVTILGYVQNQNDLTQWVNVLDHIK